MNQSKSNMNSPTVITRKSLFPIVTKHIDRLSAAQWSMLTAGTWDSDTEAVLADMLMEVIQKLSRYVFKTSMCKETRTICEDDINTALENLRAQLGDSLPGTLADALHVSPDNCESAEPLKRMVQDEVSRKVKSVVSMPPELAIIVNGSLSSMQSLSRMAHHAATCLKEYLARVNPKCLKLFCTLKASEEELEWIMCQSTENVTDTETEITEVTEVTEITEVTEVTEILIKPSDDEPDSSVSPAESGLSTASHSPTPCCSQQLSAGKNLCTFAKKQVDKVINRVLNTKKPEDDDSDEAFENTKRGSVPESQRARSASCSRTCKTSPIKNDVEGSSLHENPASNIASIKDMKKFSMELADKIYKRLFARKMSQIHPAPMRRSHSAPAVSELRRTEDATHSHCSPEVLSIKTQDAVGDFMQQVLPQMDPADKRDHREERASAPTEIESPIPCGAPATQHRTVFLVTPTEEINISVPSSPEEEEEDDVSDDVSDDVKLRHCVNSLILHQRKFIATSEDSDDFYMITPEFSFDSSVPGTSSASNSETRLGISGVITDRSSPTTERLTMNIITALFMRIAIKAPRKVSQRLQEMDVNAIIKRLSDRVMSEIEIPHSAETFMKKLNKAVIESLGKEVCSKKHLLRAALADETTFGDAIVKYLKIHLDAMLNPPPKSKAARFFSAVGNALVMPFKWCIMGHCDD